MSFFCILDHNLLSITSFVVETLDVESIFMRIALRLGDLVFWDVVPMEELVFVFVIISCFSFYIGVPSKLLSFSFIVALLFC